MILTVKHHKYMYTVYTKNHCVDFKKGISVLQETFKWSKFRDKVTTRYIAFIDLKPRFHYECLG